MSEADDIQSLSQADPAALAQSVVEGAAERSTAGLGRGVGWLFYGLGLCLQVFLWFLLFLGLALAIGWGGHLTEFRYVGF